MKLIAIIRRVGVLAALIAGLNVCVSPVAQSADEPAWRVGVAKVDITPTTPVWLAGYAGIREPDGKLRELWAKAIALEAADGGRAVLIAGDFQGVPASMSDRVFARLAAELGLDRSRVMFAYTDDMVAYVPSRRVWEERGYEGGSSLYEYGRPAFRWAGSVEDTIAAGVQRLVDQTSR